jgi:hypothetical protein
MKALFFVFEFPYLALCTIKLPENQHGKAHEIQIDITVHR